MRQDTGQQTSSAEKTIKDIRRETRKHHSAEDKIRIVLEGLRGEESIAAIYRCEGIAESLIIAGRRNLSKRPSYSNVKRSNEARSDSAG